MPRLGANLHDIFIKRQAQFTARQIYSLGIQLVNILEQIHAAGYVFNDLKLDNLMFDSNVDVNYIQTTDEDFFERLNVNIIDFGFVTPYLIKGSREHIQKHIIDTYRGNFYFSSIN